MENRDLFERIRPFRAVSTAVAGPAWSWSIETVMESRAPS